MLPSIDLEVGNQQFRTFCLGMMINVDVSAIPIHLYATTRNLFDYHSFFFKVFFRLATTM
jgi:hypothetical protein